MTTSRRLDELFDGLPKRLRISDVAQLLDVTEGGVQRWVAKGVIPAYKIGSSWIILRDELRDTLAEGSNQLGTHDDDSDEDGDDSAQEPLA